MRGHQIVSILVLCCAASAELVCPSAQACSSTASEEASATSSWEGIDPHQVGGDEAYISLAQLRAHRNRMLFDMESSQTSGAGQFRVVHDVNVTDLALQPVIDELDLPRLRSSGVLSGLQSWSKVRNDLTKTQAIKLEMYISELHHWASPICGIMDPFHFVAKIWVEDKSDGCVTHISRDDWHETFAMGFAKQYDWFFEKVGYDPGMVLKFSSWSEEPLLNGGECFFDQGDWCHMYKVKVISSAEIDTIGVWVETILGSEEEGHSITIRTRLTLVEVDPSAMVHNKTGVPPIERLPKLDTKSKKKSLLQNPFAEAKAVADWMGMGNETEQGEAWYLKTREELQKDELAKEIFKAAVAWNQTEDPDEKAELHKKIESLIKEDAEQRAANNITEADISEGLLEPADKSLQHSELPSGPVAGPEGTCSIFGDPHVIGFDRTPIKPVISLLDVRSNADHKSKHKDLSNAKGDFWLVRSPQVHIQGRFNRVEEGRLFLRGLAISGPFLKGNALLISGHANGKVLWNGEQILNATPSEFWSEGLISANHRTEKLVQDPSRNAELPGYDIEFPLGVKLVVNRGRRGLGVKISMPRLPGYQDGQCGNFNGDGRDDTPELISGRMGFQVLFPRLLFKHPFIKDYMTPLDETQEKKIDGPLHVQPVAVGEKTCTIFGDPHIIGFDKTHKTESLLNFMARNHGKPRHAIPDIVELSRNISGDFWIVKNNLIQIQGRFNQKDNRTQRTFLRSVAIGGPFLENNTLLIGKQNGKVLWNNATILSSIPSEFSNDLIYAKYHNDSFYVQDPRRIFPGIDIELPLGVKLLVNRGKNGVGMRITVPVADLPGSFDGQCGNANGIEDDDTIELIETRNSHRVESADLLFHNAFHSSDAGSDQAPKGERQIL